MGPYQHFAHAGLQALPSNLCFLQTTACYSFSRCTISLLLGCKHFQAIINKVTMDAQIYLAWWTYFAIAEVFFINSEIHKLYVCSLMSSQFICHVPRTSVNLWFQIENKSLKEKLPLDTGFFFFFFLRQGLPVSLNWLWICDLSASAYWVLGLQVCIPCTTPLDSWMEFPWNVLWLTIYEESISHIHTSSGYH
jgi:hypothetical protein